MLKVLLKFLVILVILGLADCAARSLPPYIEPCNQNDPDLNKCFVEHGRRAIPKLKNGDKTYKIPSANPLKISELVLGSGNSLKLSMKNVDAFGLHKIELLDADCRLKDREIILTLFLPIFQLVGDYEISGRVVILPITGNGKVNITAVNTDVKYFFKFNIEEENNINKFIIKENNVQYKAKRIYYDFDNLFNGDKRLASEMKKFLNENWEEIDKEFHESFNDVITAIIKTVLETVVKDIPYEQIFLP